MGTSKINNLGTNKMKKIDKIREFLKDNFHPAYPGFIASNNEVSYSSKTEKYKVYTGAEDSTINGSFGYIMRMLQEERRMSDRI